MDNNLALGAGLAGTGAIGAGIYTAGYRKGAGTAGRELTKVARGLEKSGKRYSRGSRAVGGLGKGLYGGAGVAAAMGAYNYSQGDSLGTAGYGALSGGALAAGLVVRSKGKMLGRTSQNLFNAASNNRGHARAADIATRGGGRQLMQESEDLAIQGARRR